MGYWSSHPMGGDSPLDAQCELFVFVINKEGGGEEELFNIKPSEMKIFLDKHKLSIIQERSSYLTEEGFEFVIPFTFLEYGIKLDNQEDIESVISLIGNGGSIERGYNNSEEDSPNIICDLLRKHGDEVFNSNITDINPNIINSLKDVGLFGTITNHINDDKKGLVNTK